MEDNKVSPNLLEETIGQSPNASAAGTQLQTVDFYNNDGEADDPFSVKGKQEI